MSSYFSIDCFVSVNTIVIISNKNNPVVSPPPLSQNATFLSIKLKLIFSKCHYACLHVQYQSTEEKSYLILSTPAEMSGASLALWSRKKKSHSCHCYKVKPHTSTEAECLTETHCDPALSKKKLTHTFTRQKNLSEGSSSQLTF